MSLQKNDIPRWGQARDAMPKRMLLQWLTLVLVLIFSLFVMLGVDKKGLSIADFFALHQDAPVIIVITGFLFSLRLSSNMAIRGFSASRLGGRPEWLLLVLIMSLVLIAVGGQTWVFERLPLSMDEFWASFDAAIFRHGTLLAPVRPQWRDLLGALQPTWRMQVQGGAYWASLYLPVNAAVRALWALAGLEDCASPFWMVIGCAGVYAAARQIWPDRREEAVVATLLTATSAQLVITAMTPYAMSAHFALNMIWLLLFMRGRAWSHAAALVVGFLACGLHQFIFHPLFVAPFILELLIGRRWRTATFYMAGYALIVVFWVLYWSLLLKVFGVHPGAATGIGMRFFVARVSALLAAVNLQAIGLMAENLLRFVAWQNPLTVPLMLGGAGVAMRSRGPLRPLLLGLVLTLGAMTVLEPYQGHGWGYRYLHGLLGSASLIAAQGWRVLRPPGGRRVWAGACCALAASTFFTVFVLLPWRAAQAYAFAAPYAHAYAEIRRDPADVVLVDPTGLAFGIDLVRNDPFLGNRPKVMLLSALSPSQLIGLCRSQSLSLFPRGAGSVTGIQKSAEESSPEDMRLRMLLRDDPACRAALARGAATPIRQNADASAS